VLKLLKKTMLLAKRSAIYQIYLIILAVGNICLFHSEVFAVEGPSLPVKASINKPRIANQKNRRPGSAQAISKKSAYFADVFLSVGYIIANLPPVTTVGSSVTTTPNAPTLLQGELGVSGAYRIPLEVQELSDFDFYVGATASYRKIGQYSTYDATVGNYRGSRILPIAPLIVIRAFSKLIAKFDFQILGAYVLSNPTAEGQEYSYSSPFGGRAAFMYPLFKVHRSVTLHGGIYAEYLSFKKRSISNVSETQLTQPLVMWQGGITFGWVF
jgi:hypothetical protein